MNIINISRLFQSEIEKSGENVTTQPIRGQNIDPDTQLFMKDIKPSNSSGVSTPQQERVLSYQEIFALDTSRKKMIEKMEELTTAEQKTSLIREYTNYFLTYFTSLPYNDKKFLGKLNLLDGEDSLLKKISLLLNSVNTLPKDFQQKVVQEIDTFIDKHREDIRFNPNPTSDEDFKFDKLVKEVLKSKQTEDTETSEPDGPILSVEIKFDFEKIKEYQKQYATDILKLYSNLKDIPELEIEKFFTEYQLHNNIVTVADMELDNKWERLLEVGEGEDPAHIGFTKNLANYLEKDDIDQKFEEQIAMLIVKLKRNRIVIKDIIPEIKKLLKDVSTKSSTGQAKGGHRKKRKRTKTKVKKKKNKSKRKRSSRRRNWKR
jgi:hypothetical protein